MRVNRPIIIAFTVGVLVASLAWGACWMWRQFQVSTALLLAYKSRAESGKKTLTWLDDFDDQNRRRLYYLATNEVSLFSDCVDGLAGDYPYLPIKRYWHSQAEYYKQFLKDREKTTGSLRMLLPGPEHLFDTALHTKSETVRLACILEMTQKPDPRTNNELSEQEIASLRDSNIRWIRNDSVRMLQNYLCSGTQKEKELAALTLFMAGTPESLDIVAPYYVEKLCDPDYKFKGVIGDVYHIGMVWHVKMPDGSPQESIRVYPRHVMPVILELGRCAVPYLLKTLTHHDVVVRQNAYALLCEITGLQIPFDVGSNQDNGVSALLKTEGWLGEDSGDKDKTETHNRSSDRTQ